MTFLMFHLNTNSANGSLEKKSLHAVFNIPSVLVYTSLHCLFSTFM